MGQGNSRYGNKPWLRSTASTDPAVIARAAEHQEFMREANAGFIKASVLVGGALLLGMFGLKKAAHEIKEHFFPDDKRPAIEQTTPTKVEQLHKDLKAKQLEIESSKGVEK